MGKDRPPSSLGLVLEHFKTLEDPRINRTKRHPLQNILTMALCASICGAEGWDDIALFSASRRAWFASFLDLPAGVPSADTFRRVFERLSPARFAECLRSWVSALAVDFTGEVVAIDGKTLRGLVDKAGAKTQLHLVHVWATKQRLLLAQKAVEGSPGEPAAIPELLELLELEGAVITADAHNCTAPVTRAIVDRKADYVLAVKGNRGQFYERVVDAFARRERFAEGKRHAEVEEGHGRRETRIVSVLEPDEWPRGTKKNGDWAGLRTAARIERTREIIGGETTAEIHFFVSSLPPDAKRIGEAIRSHWSVENDLHWTLDVSFSDDHRQVRNARAAENLATVDRLALCLLKNAPARHARRLSVRMSRKGAGWSNDYLTSILTSANSIP